jgi:hypothetical protein
MWVLAGTQSTLVVAEDILYVLVGLQALILIKFHPVRSSVLF